MIKPESEKMKKKLDKHLQKEQKVEAKSWCQQMSFDSQYKADRFLNLAETRWMAPEKEDRDTIRKFCKAVSKTVVEFLSPQKGHTIWCVENTDVFRGGLTSDTLRKALRKQPVLFAAVVFRGLCYRPHLAQEGRGIFPELRSRGRTTLAAERCCAQASRSVRAFQLSRQRGVRPLYQHHPSSPV